MISQDALHDVRAAAEQHAVGQGFFLGRDAGLIAARESLIETVTRLGPDQSRSLVLVGAQAVYEHTEHVELPGVQPATSDTDFVVDPDLLCDHPRVGEVMEAGGFQLFRDRPGVWVKVGADGSPDPGGVDFLVPESLAGAGRREARLRSNQGRNAVGRAAGLELALFDNEVRTVASYEDPTRAVEVRVAGPASLLCAKAYKLSERLEDRKESRVRPKDAADMYRLMTVLAPHDAARALGARQDAAAESARTGADLLERIFSSRSRGFGVLVESVGSASAAEAQETVAEWMRSFSAERRSSG